MGMTFSIKRTGVILILFIPCTNAASLHDVNRCLLTFA